MIENILKNKNISLTNMNKNSLNYKLNILKLYYKKNKPYLYHKNITKKLLNNILSKILHSYLKYLPNYTNNNDRLFLINHLKYILLKIILKYKKYANKSFVRKPRRNYRKNKQYKIKKKYPLRNYQIKLIKYNRISHFDKFDELYLRHYMGIINVLIRSNNTFINIKTNKVNLLHWMTGGSYGYKNSQKSSFFAAENIALKFGRLVKYGLKINNIIVKIKGFRGSRRNIIKGLKKARLNIFKYEDITPFAHNGCRKKKKRRL